MIRTRGAWAPVISIFLAVLGLWIANTPPAKVFTGYAGEFLLPVQQTITSVFSPVGTMITTVLDLGESRDEVPKLRAAVDQLNAEVIRLREAEIENARLRSMLDFRAGNPRFQFTAARIIALDPSSPVRAAWVDRGADAGFKEGMVVVSPAGNLVGRIVQVRPTSSRILFIVDSTNSVNSMIQRQDLRALGVINGLPGDRLVMRYLSLNDELKPGDVVVTSGLGKNYPQGMYIGKVTEVKRNEADLFQEAKVEPAVRFSRLEAVQVITNFMPQGLN